MHPQTEQNIVTNFNIEDPDDTTLDALYIQISEGYIPGEDQLIYNGSDPNLNTSWNVTEGKLEISSMSGDNVPISELIALPPAQDWNPHQPGWYVFTTPHGTFDLNAVSKISTTFLALSNKICSFVNVVIVSVLSSFNGWILLLFE